MRERIEQSNGAGAPKASAISVAERVTVLLQVLGCFYAIPAFIIILIFLGDNTRPYLYPIRATYALVCSLVIVEMLLFPRRGFWGRVQIPLAFFWVAYLSRVVHDGYIEQVDLRLRPEEYLNYAVGMCMVPMYSFFRKRGPEVLSFMFAAIFWSCFLAVALSVWVYRDLLGTSFGRLGSEEGTAVNPLTVAYMASTLMILSLYSLLYAKAKFGPKHLIYYAGIVCGVVALIMAASRGPLLAVLVCVCIALYSRLKARAFIRVGLYGVGLIGVVVVGERLADALGSNLAERIAYTREEAKAGSTEYGRLPVVELALGEFLASPLVGSGVDVKETKSYPHNLIVESFLTTGIVGGGAFLAFLWLCIRAAFRLLRGAGELAWVPLLFFAYLVESQLSGAVYMSSVFWATAALTLTVDGQLRERARSGGVRKTLRLLVRQPVGGSTVVSG